MNRHRLPKCDEIFRQVCETLEDYQKRRIDYAIDYLKANCSGVNKSSIYRITGLSYNRGSQEVHDYLEQCLQAYMDGEL